MSNLQKLNDEQKRIINEILKKNNNSSSLSQNKIRKENISVTFKCTKTHRIFNILYGRDSYNEKYKQLKIIKDIDMVAYKDSNKKSYSEKSLNFDINLFDLTDFICPYCKSKDFCKCHCGKLICSGAMEKQNSEKYLLCNWCGARSQIRGQIDKLSASNHTKNTKSIKSGISYKEIGSTNYKSLPE